MTTLVILNPGCSCVKKKKKKGKKRKKKNILEIRSCKLDEHANEGALLADSCLIIFLDLSAYIAPLIPVIIILLYFIIIAPRSTESIYLYFLLFFFFRKLKKKKQVNENTNFRINFLSD